MSSTTPLCACGCGEHVTLTRAGVPNHYLRGHNHRGKPKSGAQRELLSRAMMGKPGQWLGKHMSAESKAKMSRAKKGQTLSAEHRQKIAATMTGKPHPSVHHKQSIETRIKKSLSLRGEKGPNWRGGVTPDKTIVRRSLGLTLWREAVKRRDNYTCQKCGVSPQNRSQVQLHTHHIKPFAKYPDLRLDVNNGTTLCSKCHRETHKQEREYV